MMGFGRNKTSAFKIVRNKKIWKDIDLVIWIVPFILVHLSCFLGAIAKQDNYNIELNLCQNIAYRVGKL